MPLVELLAKECCVLIWDRRNTGAADLYFETERSEYQIWADDLAELLATTAFAPAVIAGGSAGCRVAVNAVMRHASIANSTNILVSLETAANWPALRLSTLISLSAMKRLQRCSSSSMRARARAAAPAGPPTTITWASLPIARNERSSAAMAPGGGP